MTLTYEEQQLLARDKRIKEASADLASIISFILTVYLANTRMGKTVLTIALWFCIVNYVDEKMRITERTVRLARGVRNGISEVWNA